MIFTIEDVRGLSSRKKSNSVDKPGSKLMVEMFSKLGRLITEQKFVFKMKDKILSEKVKIAKVRRGITIAKSSIKVTEDAYVIEGQNVQQQGRNEARLPQKTLEG